MSTTQHISLICYFVEWFHCLSVHLSSSLSLGSVLVLHLKRFGGPGGLEKLEAPLLFPSELRLSTLCGDMVPHLHSASPQALTNLAPSIQGSIPQTLTSQVSSPAGEAKDSTLCCSGRSWHHNTILAPTPHKPPTPKTVLLTEKLEAAI